VDYPGFIEIADRLDEVLQHLNDIAASHSIPLLLTALDMSYYDWIPIEDRRASPYRYAEAMQLSVPGITLEAEPQDWAGSYLTTTDSGRVGRLLCRIQGNMVRANPGTYDVRSGSYAVWTYLTRIEPDSVEVQLSALRRVVDEGHALLHGVFARSLTDEARASWEIEL
jgi:uncharacterized protein (TIGR04255 family)